jgi:hypothetical protein
MVSLEQFFNPPLHVSQMRPRPIDSLALRASEEFSVLMKNEIRNLSLDLLPRYWIEEGVAEEASGQSLLLIDPDVSSLNEPFQLESGNIFWDLKNMVFRFSWDEFGVSS